MAGFKDFMMGKKGGKDKFRRYMMISGRQKHFLAPLQRALKGLNVRGRSQLRGLMSYKSPQLKPYQFEDIEKPALEQWEQQVIPSILERFAGAGALNSSGLQQTLGQAAKGLETNLAANRAQQNMNRDVYNLQAKMNQPIVRQNALQHLLSMNQLGLSQTHNRYVQQGAPAQQGFLGNILPLVGAGIGAAVGGPAGAAIGGAAGNAAGGAIPGMNFNAM